MDDLGTVEIDNRKWKVISVYEVHYDYDKNPCQCGICKGRADGIPWMGWFHCEMCGAIALVKAYGDWPAGQTFVPIKEEAAA